MQQNRRMPNSSNLFVVSAILTLGLLQVAVGRQCDTYRDCLGDYLQCCNGYCRRLCNMSCTVDHHCGSPGSIEETCCKGKCIAVSTVCGKPLKTEENATSVSGPVIAVVVVFAAVLVVVASCALRSYLCKSNAPCGFGANEQEAEVSSRCRSSGFVEFYGGSVGMEDGLNGNNGSDRQAFQTSLSWVGQDFRIVPPKPKSKRPVVT